MRMLAVAPNPSIDRFFGLGHLEIGAINRPTIEARVAGGKGLNVARAARAMGADVIAVGILAGHAGRWIDEELARAGVPGEWVWVDGETRSCIAIADDRSGELTELNEAGPEITAADWDRLTATVDARLAADGVRILAISGSLPPGAPPEGVAGLVELANTRGARAIVDGSGRSLALALAARPWLVKVNLREALDVARAAGLAPDSMPGDPAYDDVVSSAATLAEVLATFAGAYVIVTVGADGAVAASPRLQTLRVTLPGVRGSYPVGSGDAFLAGLAAASLAGEPLESALRLASGAAAANALQAGAGLLDPREAFRLAASVAVAPLPR